MLTPIGKLITLLYIVNSILMLSPIQKLVRHSSCGRYTLVTTLKLLSALLSRYTDSFTSLHFTQCMPCVHTTELYPHTSIHMKHVGCFKHLSCCSPHFDVFSAGNEIAYQASDYIMLVLFYSDGAQKRQFPLPSITLATRAGVNFFFLVGPDFFLRETSTRSVAYCSLCCNSQWRKLLPKYVLLEFRILATRVRSRHGGLNNKSIYGSATGVQGHQ